MNADKRSLHIPAATTRSSDITRGAEPEPCQLAGGPSSLSVSPRTAIRGGRRHCLGTGDRRAISHLARRDDSRCELSGRMGSAAAVPRSLAGAGSACHRRAAAHLRLAIRHSLAANHCSDHFLGIGSPFRWKPLVSSVFTRWTTGTRFEFRGFAFARPAFTSLSSLPYPVRHGSAGGDLSQTLRRSYAFWDGLSASASQCSCWVWRCTGKSLATSQPASSN